MSENMNVSEKAFKLTLNQKDTCVLLFYVDTRKVEQQTPWGLSGESNVNFINKTRSSTGIYIPFECL